MAVPDRKHACSCPDPIPGVTRGRVSPACPEHGDRHWIVTGKGTGNLYTIAPDEAAAIKRAESCLGEADAWHARPLTAREIAKP